jgi:hypothetical protein
MAAKDRRGREGLIMSLTEDDKQWITAQLERVETALLTEFHKWASPVELESER